MVAVHITHLTLVYSALVHPALKLRDTKQSFDCFCYNPDLKSLQFFPHGRDREQLLLDSLDPCVLIHLKQVLRG